jgi:hypothetical protein
MTGHFSLTGHKEKDASAKKDKKRGRINICSFIKQKISILILKNKHILGEAFFHHFFTEFKLIKIFAPKFSEVRCRTHTFLFFDSEMHFFKNKRFIRCILLQLKYPTALRNNK